VHSMHLSAFVCICVILSVPMCVQAMYGSNQIVVRGAQVKFKAFVNVWATRGTVPGEVWRVDMS
jgi:hypothetical protein